MELSIHSGHTSVDQQSCVYVKSVTTGASYLLAARPWRGEGVSGALSAQAGQRANGQDANGTRSKDTLARW
jgi:hypothetical protein